jgi:ABC-2 type transport system permease protein
MVASFLTRNLTVAYILGAMFNAPLVFAAMADAILPSRPALLVKHWSVSEQFADFGRGVISLTSVAYFVAIMLVMLYLCMVLIGRRHWVHRLGGAMAGHYFFRAASLAIIAVGAVLLCQRHEVRCDMSTEKLTSLAPETRRLLADLQTDRTVSIEAFVSPTVPETYVQTRLNLLTALREMDAIAGGKVRVRVIPTEQFTEEASRAEQRFKITPREVATQSRGVVNVDRIFMGVAVQCGLNRVVVPFFDRGIPAEYELIRSICTVAEKKRKKVGVLATDAQLYGRFNMQSMSPGRNWPIIDELEKQYEVVQIDATQPIDLKSCDVLLAVQPSSLGPEQMENFVRAVRAGLPTAVFEDPAPLLAGDVPGTSDPRRPPGGMNPMMMMQQQPPPKGDIRKLWDLLGVDFSADTIIWQDYNPYPKASQFPKEFVFVDAGAGGEEPFNPDDPITSGLQQVLFPFPGSITKLNTSVLEMTPLAETGTKTGTARHADMFQMSPFGPAGLKPDLDWRRAPTNDVYVMAAHIQGEVDAPPAEEPKDEAADPAKKDAAKKKDEAKKDAKDKAKPAKAELNVVLVADVDMLSPGFFLLRERGDIPEQDVHFNFDNVTFVLNVLDSLAGSQDFLEIRKRRRVHRTLTQIEKQTAEARKETNELREKIDKEFDKAQKDEEKKLNDEIEKLRKDYAEQQLDQQAILQRVEIALTRGQKSMSEKIAALEQKKKREENKIDTDLTVQVRRVQDRYKMWAVIFPPIAPLVLAVVVFISRRVREREGVSRSRLRS